MTSKRLLLAFLLIAAVAMVGTVQASSIRIDPVVTAAFTADGNFTPIDPIPDFGTLGAVGFPAVYQVDLFMTFPTADLVGGERGFANVAFDLEFDNTSENQVASGYQPNTDLVDSNGNLPGGSVPKWASNGDAGASGTDLKGIIVETVPLGFGPAVDPRRMLGQGQQEHIGSLFVDWDGVTPGSFSVDITQFSHYNPDIAPPDGPAVVSNGARLGGTVTFAGVPEPSTWVLLGLGCIGLVASRFRRKR